MALQRRAEKIINPPHNFQGGLPGFASLGGIRIEAPVFPASWVFSDEFGTCFPFPVPKIYLNQAFVGFNRQAIDCDFRRAPRSFQGRSIYVLKVDIPE